MMSVQKYVSFIPAVFVATGILIASVSDWNHSVMIVTVKDKTMHAIAYSVLAISLMTALLYNNRNQIRDYAFTWICCTMYGALIELLQALCTVTRVAECLDMVANGIGAFAGLFVLYGVCYIWQCRKNNII